MTADRAGEIRLQLASLDARAGELREEQASLEEEDAQVRARVRRLDARITRLFRWRATVDLTQEEAAEFQARIARLREELELTKIRARVNAARLEAFEGQREALEVARSALRFALRDALG